jgi:UDP-N-acetylenolpyruvoylglucosamine reductase
MRLVQARVRERFGIELEAEPVFVGFEMPAEGSGL